MNTTEILNILLVVVATIGSAIGLFILGLIAQYIWTLTSAEKVKAEKKLTLLDSNLVGFGSTFAGKTIHGGLMELIENVDDPDDPLVQQATKTLLKMQATDLLMKRFPGLQKVKLEQAISDQLENVIGAAAKLFNGEADSYQITDDGKVVTQANFDPTRLQNIPLDDDGSFRTEKIIPVHDQKIIPPSDDKSIG